MMHHSVSHHAGLYLISKQKDISNKKTKKVGTKLSKCIIWWATNYKAETQKTWAERVMCDLTAHEAKRKRQAVGVVEN